MKIKNPVLLTIFMYVISIGQILAQDEGNAYKIYYEMTYKADSNDAALKSEMMELLVSEGKSLFRSVVQGERDTNRFHQELQKKPYAYSFTQAQYRILKDVDKDSIYYYETIEPLFGPLCTYRETKDSMSWALTGDTMTIGDFSCQKALLNFGNRSWEAWFCPDVPLSDGPYKFCGLPGLIVRIGDVTGSWLFELVKMEQIPPFVFDLAFLDNPTILEKMAFYKRKRYYRDNAPLLDEAAGRVIFPNEEFRQMTYKSNRENAAKDNNWIERYP